MNELSEQNVLMFTRTMGLGGTENVVLQMCEMLKNKVKKIVVCSCGGVNVECLENMGIEHVIIPDIVIHKPQEVLKVVCILNRIIKEYDITLIHTHHRMAAFYVAILQLYKKCTFISTSHNTFYDKKRMTRFAYKHSNIIACGEMVRQNLMTEYGLSQNHITVIHNAIKPFEELIVEDLLIKNLHEQGFFVVGNIGRLSEQKGMEYFIKAIKSVLDKNPKTRFVIVGQGEDEGKLKDLVKELDVEEYVYFLGYRSDVQNLMAQLDLVVLSSLWEGLPLTPIEAFSVGKTVIGTAVDGTVEIIIDGENGLLINPRDEKQISDNIIWMIEHPEERMGMEKQAYLTYKQEFMDTVFEKKLEQYYKECVGEK